MAKPLKRFDFTLWKIDGSTTKHGTIWAPNKKLAGVELDRDYGSEWKIVTIEEIK